MNLLWTPHNLAFLGALRAQIPTPGFHAHTDQSGVARQKLWIVEGLWDRVQDVVLEVRVRASGLRLKG